MNRLSVLSNFFWIFGKNCGSQIVTFVVSIVLARLLEPETFGTLAIMLVITSLLDVFVECGLGTALVQKKDADDVDFSSVFYFNLVFCVILYGLLFITAPFIADFYDDELITRYIRVLGTTIIISGLRNVQMAYVAKNMIFKKVFFTSLAGTVSAAAVGIFMAYAGAGVWALIAQYLCNNLVSTVLLWLFVRWRPIMAFSFERLKGLVSFGWKLLASSIVAVIYSNLATLIIGKVYSKADLAFYNRGQSIPGMFVDNINASINSVLFPTMSKIQDDRVALKSVTRRCMKTSIYIIAPMMIGLAVVGKPLVGFLLTDKWLPCVPFMQITCITLIFYPLHTSNLNAMKAMGRSDLFLKLEIIKRIVGLAALLITAPISIMAMAYSLLVTSVLSQIINSWPNRKLLDYGYLEQLKDILPGILLAVAMGFCIYPIQFLGLSDIVTLCIQVPLGALIYVAGSVIFKLESFTYLWDMIKPILMRER